ncbi:MAG: galactokinase [Solirubrobacterales bacterium]
MARERAVAFAPGRVNLIGEHTDYNGGLALPFAIAEGITVHAERTGQKLLHAHADDFGEEDEFALDDRSPAEGWRAFLRGMVAELQTAGFPPVGARLQIAGDLPAGAGLSSSAALEVALCLALLALHDDVEERLQRVEIARLCSRVENDWVGAQTGLLDQLASLCGLLDTALLIDFRTLQIDPVPLRLDGWRLVVLDSGERHAHAHSGYNERRAECARACELLGVESLRDADAGEVERLPRPLRDRASHVVSENQRVRDAVAALRERDLPALGALLSASHASLRDRYEASTPTVEATVARLLGAGAAGARMIGGGFGGCVLGLLAPGVSPPTGAREVRPSIGAHLLD